MQHEERLDRLWQRDINEECVATPLDGCHDTDTVDVALHDVSTEPVTHPQRPLEIDACSFLPIANRGTPERGHYRGGVKPAGAEFANGKAGAIYSDALAIPDVGELGANAKLASGIGLSHAPNFANLLDQSGKHSSLTQHVHRHHILAKLRAPDDGELGEHLAKVTRQFIEWTERAGAKTD